MNRTLQLAGSGLNVSLQQQGNGLALIYLHGSFGIEWSRSLIDALAHSHSVIAPHLPGYGDSDGLERINSFYDLSVWLDEVMDALDLSQVTLVGHDFGGAAAAEYAALFRRRVSRLVLLAPYGLWPQGDPLPDIFGLTPGALTRLLYADPSGPHAEQFNAPPADKAEQMASILRRRQALIAAAKLLWPIPDKGLKHRLYRISAPSLVIGGRQDQLLNEAYVSDFAARIAGASLSWVDGGHMIPQEQALAAADQIGRFLNPMLSR